jgi:hypothetical protein
LRKLLIKQLFIDAMPEKRMQDFLPKVASDKLEVYWRMLELRVQLLVIVVVLATVMR